MTVENYQSLPTFLQCKESVSRFPRFNGSDTGFGRSELKLQLCLFLFNIDDIYLIWQHTSISSPSVCTQRHIRNYFVHGVLPEPDTVCDVIGKPFPHSELETVVAGSQSMLADMSQEDRHIFTAIHELSKTHVIPRPHILGTGLLGWGANQCWI